MKPSERSKAARSELETAIIDYLKGRPEGAINNEIARDLGLESDFEGRQKNYLSYSLLGGLLKRGLVIREERGQEAVQSCIAHWRFINLSLAAERLR